MNSINLQYNEVVQVNRFVDVEDTNKKILQVHIEELKCVIQPLEAQISQDIDGGFGKDFLMFCATADVQEGDRIIRDTDESGPGRQYRVTAIEKFEFMGNRHMEVSIRIFES